MPRFVTPPRLLVLVLAPLSLLTACAGSLSIPAQRPPDYAMVLTIYPISSPTPSPTTSPATSPASDPAFDTGFETGSGAGRGTVPVPGAGDAPFRAARYAIEPDGLLRAQVGAGVTEPDYPPIARRLEPSQLETLYAHTRLLDLDHPESFAVPVPGPQVYKPPAGKPVALVEIASLGIARAFEIDTTDPKSIPLIRELERLTWQSQD